jgi:cysteine desulfurase/selenocysteine lyase
METVLQHIKPVIDSDPESLRKLFPILNQKVNGRPLIYFDNAATTQKPQCVIDSINDYYESYNSNIHRGIHTLAEKATSAFEKTRLTSRDFIHAREKEEIIFTYGTTDGINLVAQSYGRKFLKKEDEILISCLEHHSNIVPWQMVCGQTGASLKVVPVNDKGEIIFEEFAKLLTSKTTIVSIAHVSNALGTINPVKEIIDLSHQAGAIVLIDGAQAAAHLKIDVQELDCDFYVLSSHKVFGPTGTGILYGKRSLLEKMDPYRGGGEMIKEVHFESTTYNDLPYKFEAGTPNIADVIGFGAALNFYSSLSQEVLRKNETELLIYAGRRLHDIKGLRIIGEASEKIGILSMTVDKVHHFDIGTMLDTQGIAVRTGHHCTQPLMDRFKIEGTTRVSLSIYNTRDEIDQFIEALNRILNKLR